ncbi:uncharacterized protein [Panulirus ornatus]|uniref:uncharacterized protein isoform X2 n=1 Tax=Panulirus ornatus TaxID=150431 RepID=UPI003A8720D0
MGGRAVSTAVVVLLLLLAGRSTTEGAQNAGGDGLVEEEYPGLGLDYPGEHADYHYQQDLVDFESGRHYVPILPPLGNSTLRKCRCGGEEVWDGSTCYNQTTAVAMLELLTRQSMAVYTSSFGNVEVGPLNCSENQRLVVLDVNENSLNFVYILESGDLFLDEQVFQDYCIDHVLDDHNNPSAMEVHLCLRQVTVPRCCPTGQALDANNACIPHAAHNLTLPVKVGQELLEWEDRGDGRVTNITCGSSSETLYRVIDNKDVSLVYSFQGALLDWLPPTRFSRREKREDFCVGLEASSVEEATPSYRAKFCFKDPVSAYQEACSNATCVRKCCPEGFFHTDICVPVELPSDMWHPMFHDPETLSVDVPTPDNLKVLHGYPICEAFFQLESHRMKEDEFYLLQDGLLYVPNFSKKFPADRYCLDKFLLGDVVHTLPLVCFQEDSASASAACTAVQSFVYPVLLAVSCVFLAITLLIYVSVPELHAKVHGKCLVSHMSALLLAYVSLITVQWASGLMPLAACKIMASVTHFSFLAAFFWLNVMCFDIWWTLKSMRPVAETGELSRFRFKMYSVYSWGCPVVISLVAIIIQALPEHLDIIRPEFGSRKCWFDNNRSLWAYFYGFVLVLVVANIIFFCQVAYILIMAQNDPIIQRTRQQNRERMWLYVKLFLVMGLTWIAEVISWQEGTCEAWIITDIINALQGFSIFLIFICKKNMLRRIRSNWEPYLRRVKEFFGSSRQPQSVTGKGGQETSSFSSSVNRPSQSSASQRTVQSQISLDPSTASRKLSTSSLVSTTGVQVHSPGSISMDTINEVVNSEIEHGQEGSGSNLSSTGSGCQRESTINCRKINTTQETAMSSGSGQTGSVEPPHGSLTATEKVTPLITNSRAAPQSADDPTKGDIEESDLPQVFENKLPLEDVKEGTSQTETEAENSAVQRDSLDTEPTKMIEYDAIKKHEGTEQFALGNGSVTAQHNRAFTTEEVDDQPVHV